MAPLRLNEPQRRNNDVNLPVAIGADGATSTTILLLLCSILMMNPIKMMLTMTIVLRIATTVAIQCHMTWCRLTIGHNGNAIRTVARAIGANAQIQMTHSADTGIGTAATQIATGCAQIETRL